jgi:hypothetical protein
MRGWGHDAVVVGEAVGKHPATIRKLFARNPPENALMDQEDAGNTVSVDQGDIEAALDKPEDPLHAFKREAGEPVGDMPPGEPPADPVSEVRYRGTRQTCLDFGPNADLPTGGTLTVKSEKLASGHFGLGDVITGTFTARVTGFGAKEKFDKGSEEYRASTVPYVATITEISYEPVDGGE